MSILLAIIILVIALIIGIPAPFAFASSIIYIILKEGIQTSVLYPYAYSQMSTTIILAIPLFIMAGQIMHKGGIASHLINLIELLIGRIKGGLGVVIIFSSAVFGSITGSAVATLVTIGSIMLPRLKESGYSRGYASALIANASVLGMLIPPSTIMILYAWVSKQSVLASFLSTIVPGIILIILLIFVNMVLIRNQDIKVADRISFSELQKQFGKQSIKATPALFLPVFVLGGIYGGIMTPTEAAAVSALYSIPIALFIYKGLTVKGLKKIFIESAVTTGVIMLMLFTITMLNRLYIMLNLPEEILNLLMKISEQKVVLLLLINLFMILIGCLMDDMSATVLAAPMLLPVVVALGVDPIQFAAILAINLGMGLVTPPTAPLLFISGNLGNVPLYEMLKPTLMMILFAWLPTLLITTYIPEVSLFLPYLLLK